MLAGDLGIQIAPGWVGFFNQSKFPSVPPLFNVFLASNCVGRIVVGFKPDKPLNAISR
jgi:hypothetical protein